MTDNLKEILFSIFDLEKDAAYNQKIRGISDRGRRSEITSGRHFDPLASYLSDQLSHSGLSDKEIFIGDKKMEIPGWFRPNKKWDLLAFHDDALVAAIELKSIGSSYGNNFNNRTEEALGSATDAMAAIRYSMYGGIQPPFLGYVMVVRDDEKSRKKVERIAEPHFPVDPVFHNQSYLDRFATMCSRMLSERIYDAVWLVFVDTDKKEVNEPVEALSYGKFMQKLINQIGLFL